MVGVEQLRRHLVYAFLPYPLGASEADVTRFRQFIILNTDYQNVGNIKRLCFLWDGTSKGISIINLILSIMVYCKIT